MSNEKPKFYTAEEAAILVLKKTEELLKNSKLVKSNTSHEVEAGQEPNNEDAECPAYLAEADIESGSSTGKHGEAKAGGDSEIGESAEHEAGESDEEEVAEGDEDEEGKKKKKIPEHEEGLSGEEKETHDSTESESDEEEIKEEEGADAQKRDEADADKIEDKEEGKEKKPFGKSEVDKACKSEYESGQMKIDLKKPKKLNAFMEKRKSKKKALKGKEDKNKKVEKFLGLGGSKTSGQTGGISQGTKGTTGGTGNMKTNLGSLFGGKKKAPVVAPKPPKTNTGY